MERLKCRAWNKEAKRYANNHINIQVGVVPYVLNYTDDDGLGVIKSLTTEKLEQFCDCEDAEGTEIFESDYIVDSYLDDDGNKKFSYYPVVWDQRNLQWAVDVSFNRDMKTLEALHAYTHSLVVGNINEGISKYGHSDKED